MVTIVAAVDEKGLMGVSGGGLPWHLPEELRHFKASTMGHKVVMGRKTFETIGHALPGRRVLVLTRQEGWSAEGVEVFSTPEEVLKLVEDESELMVAGGREIYELFLPHADLMLLSVVEGTHEGDIYFPPLGEEWSEVASLPKKGFQVKLMVKKEL